MEMMMKIIITIIVSDKKINTSIIAHVYKGFLFIQVFTWHCLYLNIGDKRFKFNMQMLSVEAALQRYS